MPLERLVDEARRATSGVPILRQLEAIVAAGADRVGAASAGVAQKTLRHSQNEFRRLGIDLRQSEPHFGALIEEWRKVNVSRITSLGEFERHELTGILSSGYGKTVSELRGDIRERFDVTRAKADLLARDQVLTLNAQIGQARAVAAGITEFYWTTSGDERVRESHAAIDGERFEYDDPPEVDGEHVLPGEPINCRCVACPILPELED